MQHRWPSATGHRETTCTLSSPPPRQNQRKQGSKLHLVINGRRHEDDDPLSAVLVSPVLQSQLPLTSNRCDKKRTEQQKRENGPCKKPSQIVRGCKPHDPGAHASLDVTRLELFDYHFQKIKPATNRLFCFETGKTKEIQEEQK